jgi:hypothetical protein
MIFICNPNPKTNPNPNPKPNQNTHFKKNKTFARNYISVYNTRLRNASVYTGGWRFGLHGYTYILIYRRHSRVYWLLMLCTHHVFSQCHCVCVQGHGNQNIDHRFMPIHSLTFLLYMLLRFWRLYQLYPSAILYDFALRLH